MKIKVNEEGILLLKTMSASIFESVEQISDLASALSACADEHSDTLGPHKASIDEAIEEIEQSTKEATEPVNSITNVLNEVAEAYQEIIDNVRFKGSSGS